MSSLLNSFKGLAAPAKNGIRKQGVDSRTRFRVEPSSGDSGFAQWHDAMRMVARLPGGIPYEFRKRLWLTMANKHIQHRTVNWDKIKRFCFNDKSNPDDSELGVQIVKDLHRTGCSLFCGADAERNQALLKRVLLAYARWNKTVGYCQGFNMLAALILEVVEWKEEDALKVMIYLIEGVLPESYFANNLRGLSVDMAVFRDLLRMRLPLLSKHLDYLQMEAKDSTSGAIYEPPLTNVFTMQWFLTIFSNCLPKDSVLRVWDLMFLEGNEVLLRTALAIWDGLASRIMTVESADEFYSIMGVLTRETLEFGIMDANHLVKMVCTLAPFPFPQLAELRDKYTYNITPFPSSAAAINVAKKGFRLFYSDDEEEEEDQLAVAAWCFSTVFPPQLSPISNKEGCVAGHSPSPSSSGQNFYSIGPGAFGFHNQHMFDQFTKNTSETERMTLDISSLKKQYAKLRERQKQAHVILKAATMRQQTGDANQRVPSKPHSTVMNHLLLGKRPLVSRKGRIPSAISSSQPSTSSKPLTFKFKPPDNQSATKCIKANTSGIEVNKSVNDFGKYRRYSLPIICMGETLHWKDAKKTMPTLSVSKTGKKSITKSSDDSSSSTSTELCDEDAGKLTDFGSDLENDDNDDKTEFLIKPNSINLDNKFADDKAHLSTTMIPSVVVSPEIPERNWEETATESKNSESVSDIGRLCHSETSSPNDKWDDETLVQCSWNNDNDSVDNDDDFSEEKHQEWLAKLEIYRKTLGNFDDDTCSTFQPISDEFYSSLSDQSQHEANNEFKNTGFAEVENDSLTLSTKPTSSQQEEEGYIWQNNYDYFDQQLEDDCELTSKTSSESTTQHSSKKYAESDCSSVLDNCSSSVTTSYAKSAINHKNIANQSLFGRPQKVLFNPFPVARKSPLRGSSEVGVKLGLYEPSPVTSPSRRKYSPTTYISKIDSQSS